MYIQEKTFSNGKPILFGLGNAMRTPYSVALSKQDIKPDANGEYIVNEGSFICTKGTAVRWLPRAIAKGTHNTNADATATNSKLLTLKTPNFAFKEGDVLHAVAGYGLVTAVGAFVTGEVVTLRINDVNYSFTVAGTQTAAAVAAGLAALSFEAGITVTQLGSGATISIYADDAYKVEVITTSVSGTLVLTSTEPGYLGDNLVALGTIETVGTPNNAGERLVSLVDNAAYVVPANCRIGIKVDRVLGLYPDPLDFTKEPVQHLAPIVEAAGVYQANLPYVDLQLKRDQDKLYMEERFWGGTL